ncbi:FAD-dependent thymidylate synthase [bacterium]|nr:FAD-dependent thymidylate synthase [bacterium]MBU1983639.1 FAD-dependent thymidylate synthase [bacterium]
MPLTVRLAGYNVDADLLTQVIDLLGQIDREIAGRISSLEPSDCRVLLAELVEKAHAGMNLEAFTPETIAAAYARISRDPKQIGELRRAARFAVARARKSNDTIIFGYGHASVAEHACFNLDILGLSRLATEELQSHRLVSFTEKSQRYITLSADFVIPPELTADSHWEKRLGEAVPRSFAAYEEACRHLTDMYRGQQSGVPSSHALQEIENRAKEDARYLLPLCCATQMGMTVNARNLEHITCDLSDHPLQELRDLGKALRETGAGLAPSLVKYTSRGSYPRQNRAQLKRIFTAGATEETQIISRPSVRLLASTPDAEERVLRALAFTSGMDGNSLSDESSRSQMWKEVFRNISSHDGPMREFELADLTFETELSASCFAQIKRHRMMTLLKQPYSVSASAILPRSFEEAGISALFRTSLDQSRQLAQALESQYPDLAPYLLTNAHVRKVILHINVRELYHFARLRCDGHAQWEVRDLADQMLEIARREWPNLTAMAVGADRFAERYREMFG